jgi:preprotein translocase subunit SecG
MTCITLVILVLLQQGKGAEIGAVFGGSSQTVFGSSGAGNLLARLTGVAAGVFFLSAIYLAWASTQRVTGSVFEGHTAAPITVPYKPMAPRPAAPKKPTAPAPPASAPAAPSGNPLSPLGNP